MAIVKLDTGFNIELSLPIAPFHKRLIAWVIDLLIQFAYLWIVSEIISGLVGSGWEGRHKWLAILVSLPVFLYHLICEITLDGQSFGKKALQIKVITTGGGQPSVSQYIIRWAFKPIDFPIWLLAGIGYGAWPAWVFIFLFAGVLCIVFTHNSQRIGDVIAGTVLINTKVETSWQDTIFIETENNYKPQFPQVMQLSDKDINTIKQVLASTYNAADKRKYIDRIANKLKDALNIKEDIEGIELMEVLLKDYNHLSTM